jgi:anti-anti-sigma factor
MELPSPAEEGIGATEWRKYPPRDRSVAKRIELERNVSVTLDQRGEVSVVGLEGEVDIRAAAELKGALIAALESRQELRVEMAGVTTLDITTLQLLRAFARAAANTGAKLVFGEMPKAMDLAMELSGLERIGVDPK